MTRKFEAELNKIVELYGSKIHNKELKQSIIKLFELHKQGDLEDEKVDTSHISERQTDIFTIFSKEN